jgi:hypothetical protein
VGSPWWWGAVVVTSSGVITGVTKAVGAIWKSHTEAQAKALADATARTADVERDARARISAIETACSERIRLVETVLNGRIKELEGELRTAHDGRLSDHRSVLASQERLLSDAIERERAVVTALLAIENLPGSIRQVLEGLQEMSQADALQFREMVRDELERAFDRRR